MHLFAYEDLDVASTQNSQNVIKYIYCIEDKNDTLNFDAVRDKDDLKVLKKSNLGYTKSAYWCKLNLENTSQNKKTVVLSNPRSGIDYIDVHVYGGKEVQAFNLGDMRPLANRSLPSLYSNILLDLEVNEKMTIISKVSNMGPIELSWRIQSLSEYINFEIRNIIFNLFFIGFLAAMMLYKISMFIFFKEKIFFVYALYIAVLIISHATLHGIVHYFFNEHLDYFIMTLANWVFTQLSIALLWLFTFYFFNVKKGQWPYYFLLGIIYYNFAVTLFYVYGYIDQTVLQSTEIIATIAFLESALMLIFSFVMFYQKKYGAKYFLMAHILYFILIMLYILSLLGSVELGIISQYAMVIGTFVMVIFMSIALNDRLRSMKHENENLKEQLEKNQQFIMIGTTISYVTHQWKQPLSILSSLIMGIFGKIEHTPKAPISSIKEKVSELEEVVVSLDETLSSIKKLFTSSDTKETNFKVVDVILMIKKTFENELEDGCIELRYEMQDDYILHGNKNLFTHVMRNLIQNSIEAFHTDRYDSFISIRSSKDKNDVITIEIKDNAGGIQIEPIESIFEPNITNKTFGTGIGLTIVKNILISKFRALIFVENVEGGARFVIKLCKG